MGSGRRARINEEIKQMRARLSAILEQRSARAAKENYLHVEFGFDSRGPYVARYMYLLVKLVVLYVARIIAPLLPEK